MKNWGAIKSLGFTIRQAWIINHLIEYEFLYTDDIKSKGLSKSALRALVKGGHVEKHPKMHFDELHYDLSDQCHKRVMEVINNA
jgi:hypothetical protein